MPTDVQLLKAYGHLPYVDLNDAPKESARSVVSEDDYELLNRKCAHPDRYDPEIAGADEVRVSVNLDLDLDSSRSLVEAHNRMGAFNDSGGSETAELYNNAKWPKNCHGEDLHTVKVFVDWDSFPSHNMRPCTDAELGQIVEAGVWGWSIEEVRDRFAGKPMARVALALSDEAYRRVGVKHVYVDDGIDGQEHQIHITSKPIPGSTIGIAWFPNGTCGDHVNHHIDTIQFSLMGLARLFCHEYGHNHGEPHQFNGQSSHRSVMSYSPPRLFYGFLTGKEGILPRDRSLDSLLEKYGGPLDDEPEPEPPAPPSQVVVGTFEDRGETYTITRGGEVGGVWS